MIKQLLLQLKEVLSLIQQEEMKLQLKQETDYFPTLESENFKDQMEKLLRSFLQVSLKYLIRLENLYLLSKVMEQLLV